MVKSRAVRAAGKCKCENRFNGHASKHGFAEADPVFHFIAKRFVRSDHVGVWAQELSCGALCQNLMLAANASGWAGCWLTERIAFSPGINALLGLTEQERIAGYIYLGAAKDHPQERMRPDVSDKITRWVE